MPQAAVTQTEQGYLVFVADADNKVAPRPVQVGAWQGKDWVILGGLKAGDQVIVDNLMKLTRRPGRRTVAPQLRKSAARPTVRGARGSGPRPTWQLSVTRECGNAAANHWIPASRVDHRNETMRTLRNPLRAFEDAPPCIR